MARSAELAVFTSSSDFREQEFVHIPLDILKGLPVFLSVLLHDGEDFINGFHRLHQQGRFRDDEHGVFHMMGEVGLRAVHILKKGEYLGLHMLEHIFGLSAFEFAPAQAVFVDAVFAIILSTYIDFFQFAFTATQLCPVFWWHPDTLKLGGVRLTSPLGISLTLQVQFIQTFHKQQVGDLLDGR